MGFRMRTNEWEDGTCEDKLWNKRDSIVLENLIATAVPSKRQTIP